MNMSKKILTVFICGLAALMMLAFDAQASNLVPGWNGPQNPTDWRAGGRPDGQVGRDPRHYYYRGGHPTPRYQGPIRQRPHPVVRQRGWPTHVGRPAHVGRPVYGRPVYGRPVYGRSYQNGYPSGGHGGRETMSRGGMEETRGMSREGFSRSGGRSLRVREGYSREGYRGGGPVSSGRELELPRLSPAGIKRVMDAFERI